MWGGAATLVPDSKTTPAMWRLHNDVRTAPGLLQPPAPESTSYPSITTRPTDLT